MSCVFGLRASTGAEMALARTYQAGGTIETAVFVFHK